MESKTLKEWAPLTGLLEKIPLTVGLFQNLKLTCVSAVSDRIVLGTDCGLLLWYNRKNDIQKLRLEYALSVTTCVNVLDSVDWMVAAGDDSGRVTIFQIEKEHPPDLATLAPKPKPIERFTITGLRLSPITCVQWSKNGMKLFSGDRSGKVVLTEINYHAHSTRSREIINEAYEIIQLSFLHPNHLLISTCYRTIVCHKDESDSWKVAQVGKKDRKALSPLGATFIGKKFEEKIVAARPGYRLWLAEINGDVKQTLVYKEAMNNSHCLVPLLNPVKHPINWISTNFGLMYPLDEDRVLTSAENVIYLLNLKELTVEQVVQQLRGVLDISVNSDGEVFILETSRNLIRLATEPEKEEPIRRVEPLSPLWQNVQDGIDDVDAATIAEEEEHLHPVLPFEPNLLTQKLENAQRRLNQSTIKFESLDPTVLTDPIVFKSKAGRKSKSKVGSKSRSKIMNLESSLESSTRKLSDISIEVNKNETDLVTKAALLDNSMYDELPKPPPSKEDLEQKERELANILNIEPIVLEPIESLPKSTPKRDILLTMSYPLPAAAIIDSPKHSIKLSPYRSKVAYNENLTDDMKNIMVRSAIETNKATSKTVNGHKVEKNSFNPMSKSMCDLPSPAEILNINDYMKDIPSLWNKMEVVGESDKERQEVDEKDGDISQDWEFV